jgi:hypothetical protein
MTLIRHYDGLVQARSALKRAISYCDDLKTKKQLTVMHRRLELMVKKLRGQTK